MRKGTWCVGNVDLPDCEYRIDTSNPDWSGYTQQETVLFDMTKQPLTCNQLIQLVDGEFEVRALYQPYVSFTSKNVIVVSTKAPEEIYERGVELYQHYNVVK